jgi:hypothetical protein
MGMPASERVQRYREGLRAQGLRPVQIWVPDVRRPGFDAECRRQSRLAAKADSRDPGLSALVDSALTDVDGWSE